MNDIHIHPLTRLQLRRPKRGALSRKPFKAAASTAPPNAARPPLLTADCCLTLIKTSVFEQLPAIGL